MKIKRKGIIFLIGVIIISLFSMIPLNTYSKKNVMPWMSYIHDDTKISDISIPGTHDSGATHSIFDVSGKCQDLSIKQQLRVGVRFFDLRLQLVNDEFKIVHSFVDQRLSFKKVMKDLSNFINENNSEFIIISLKKEASDKNSTLDFASIIGESMIKLNLDMLNAEANLLNSSLTLSISLALKAKISAFTYFLATISLISSPFS